MVSQRNTRRKRGEADSGEELMSLPLKRPKNVAKAFLDKLQTSERNAQLNLPFFRILSPELRSHIYEMIFQPVVFRPSESAIIAHIKPKKRQECRHIECSWHCDG